jgi:hypothetical protein
MFIFLRTNEPQEMNMFTAGVLLICALLHLAVGMWARR